MIEKKETVDTEGKREEKNKGNVRKRSCGRKKKITETPGFQLVAGEMGCRIYWKDCPELSVSGVGR